MTAGARDELRALVDQLPDDQVEPMVHELRARLAGTTGKRPWRPEWFGMADGGSTDTSERVDEILADGLGAPRR